MPRNFNLASLTLSLELSLPISAASFIESNKSYTETLLLSPLQGSARFATHIFHGGRHITQLNLFPIRHTVTLTNTYAGCQRERVLDLRVTRLRHLPEGIFQPIKPGFSVTRDECACSERRYSLTSLSFRPVERQVRAAVAEYQVGTCFTQEPSQSRLHVYSCSPLTLLNTVKGNQSFQFRGHHKHILDE